MSQKTKITIDKIPFNSGIYESEESCAILDIDIDQICEEIHMEHCEAYKKELTELEDDVIAAISRSLTLDSSESNVLCSDKFFLPRRDELQIAKDVIQLRIKRKEEKADVEKRGQKKLHEERVQLLQERDATLDELCRKTASREMMTNFRRYTREQESEIMEEAELFSHMTNDTDVFLLMQGLRQVNRSLEDNATRLNAFEKTMTPLTQRREEERWLADAYRLAKRMSCRLELMRGLEFGKQTSRTQGSTVQSDRSSVLGSKR